MGKTTDLPRFSDAVKKVAIYPQTKLFVGDNAETIAAEVNAWISTHKELEVKLIRWLFPPVAARRATCILTYYVWEEIS